MNSCNLFLTLWGFYDGKMEVDLTILRRVLKAVIRRRSFPQYLQQGVNVSAAAQVTLFYLLSKIL